MSSCTNSATSTAARWPSSSTWSWTAPVAFYQAGRRTEREWRGCGSVLRARIIEAVAAQGATEYDLLRGDESYKTEWATDHRELVRCVMGVGLGRAAVRLRAVRDARAARAAGDEESAAGDLSP